MKIDNALHSVQTDASPVIIASCACRIDAEETLKNHLMVFTGNTNPVIFDTDKVIRVYQNAKSILMKPSIPPVVNRIFDEIIKDASQLITVSHYTTLILRYGSENEIANAVLFEHTERAFLIDVSESVFLNQP